MSQKSMFQWTKDRRAGLILAGVVVAVLSLLGNRWPAGPKAGDHFNGVKELHRFSGDTLTVMTYNIHSFRGDDGVSDADRIAKVLEGADIIGLNEVRGPNLIGGPNQAEILGEKLGMPWLFAATEIRWLKEDFGNGVLCRPMVKGWVKLPFASGRKHAMRNFVLFKAEHPKGDVNVIVTHIASADDDEQQLKALVNLFMSIEEPVIMMGDFNNRITHPLLGKLINENLAKSVVDYSTSEEHYIDWILYRGLECIDTKVHPRGPSDHPAIRAEFAFPDEDTTSTTMTSGAGES